MSGLEIFVSHAHEDDEFCRKLVVALRSSGADVWYDEHNMISGVLMDEIQKQLKRNIFIVILSKAAFASDWVKNECQWAHRLRRRDQKRIILPITAGPIDAHDFDPDTGWLFLEDYRRIEAPDYQPFPANDAIRRTINALQLPLSQAPNSDVPTALAEQHETHETKLKQSEVAHPPSSLASASPVLPKPWHKVDHRKQVPQSSSGNNTRSYDDDWDDADQVYDSSGGRDPWRRNWMEWAGSDRSKWGSEPDPVSVSRVELEVVPSFARRATRYSAFKQWIFWMQHGFRKRSRPTRRALNIVILSVSTGLVGLLILTFLILHTMK